MASPTDSFSLHAASLDDIVEAYESACARVGSVPVEDFLPPRQHPDYESICCELLCVDFEKNWQRDSSFVSLESYRRNFPDLLSRPRILQQVALEEYRLRCLRGDVIEPTTYANKYGIDTHGWPRTHVGDAGHKSQLLPNTIPSETHPASAVETALRGSTAVDGDQRLLAPDLLVPGQQVADFEIVQQLGEGKFGRVYLARQRSLAGRLVVVKVTTSVWRESDRLARLQHTYVVPVYSVHQNSPYQMVCMPYLGTVTLSEYLRSRGVAKRLGTGAEIVTYLQNVSRSMESVIVRAGVLSSPSDSSHRETDASKRLRSLSHESTCSWYAACIADGLAHAHERGILHRDLKPANILITDEGLPMILDFNLADDQSDDTGNKFVGGTLPYMSPEHLRAILRSGSVDARSDIYSLGVLLFQMLTGELPFDSPDGLPESTIPGMVRDRAVVPSLRARDASLSRSIESIVNRCLAPLPEQRYQTAHELFEDLDCHLRDLPMRYAYNPSLTERVKKWWRRHPRATSVAGLSTVAGLFIIFLGALLGVRSQQVARYSALQTFGVFQDAAREATSQLSLLGSDVEIRREGIDVAQQALQLWNADRDDWETQHPIVDLPESERVAVRESIREILYLLAADQARMAQQTQGKESGKHIESALQFNRRGQQLSQHDPLQRSVVFDLQQHELQTLGLADGTEDKSNGRDGDDATTLAVLPSEWLDRYLLAVRCVNRERYEQAIPIAEALSQERPKDVDTWLLLGHSYASRGQLHDAELCYTRCIALWPQVKVPYYIYFFRGISRLQAKNAAGAEDDFSEVLRQRPNHLHSLVNRALSRYEQKHVVEAVADLTQAIDKAEGDEDGRWFLLRARCWRQLGELDSAEEDRERGLSIRPTDEEGWISRGLARLPEDPAGARRDLDEARKLYPHSRRLLQNLAHLLADELRDTDAALGVLDRMLTMDPQDATALAGRGVLQARRGAHEPAIRDAKLAIQASRTPAVSYQVACIYAQLSRKDHGQMDETVLAAHRHNAVAFLAEALRQDDSWLRLVPRDPDLEPMRDDSEFQEVLRAAAVLQRPAADLSAI